MSKIEIEQKLTAIESKINAPLVYKTIPLATNCTNTASYTIRNGYCTLILNVNYNKNLGGGNGEASQADIINTSILPKPKANYQKHIVVYSNGDKAYKHITFSINTSGLVYIQAFEPVKGSFNIKYVATYPIG